MNVPDYYKDLGVSESASADEIKRAFRAIAKQYHPDSYSGDDPQGAEARFKRASEAYEVLSDPERRKQYDQLRKGGFAGAGVGARPAGAQGASRTMTPEEFEAMFGGMGGDGFSDFFASMFGESFARQAGRRRGGHPRYATRGADVRAVLELPLREVFRGGTRTFKIAGNKPCESCGGVGFLEGDHVCPACAGVGHRRVTKTIELALPKQPRHDQVIRLRGLGEPSARGDKPGDLLLTLRIVDDPPYRVSGEDVQAELPIAPWEAALGGRVDVLTPEGTRASVTIPAGARPGARLRLKGQGLYRKDGSRGDLYLELKLVLPERLTDEQRKLLEQLAATDRAGVHGGARVAGG
ncbi:MAG: curved DNA-binding protein [Phycisphaerales bacterium]|nr:MAG: curved DNA-binding protein [Phycisphaerales bacterium]